MANNISILEKTKDYVVLKIPRRLIGKIVLPKNQLSEADALRILKAGTAEYKHGKTRVLTSLRSLRNGD